MNGRDLLEGMGYIADRFVDEAETASVAVSKTPYRWRNLAAMAACVCLILGGLWLASQRGMRMADTAGNTAEQEKAAEDVCETAAASMGANSMQDEADVTAAAADAVIWNERETDTREDMEVIIPRDAVEGTYDNARAFELLGGKCLPDTLLEKLALEDSECLIWENPDGTTVEHLLYLKFFYGEDLQVTARPTERSSLPVNDDWIYPEGCLLYRVEEDSVSTVSGCDVFFYESAFTVGNTERTAYLIVNVPGTDRYVMLKLYTETLTREEMEQAVAQIIEFGR